MTMREMFKKVDTYNEVAEIMQVTKAQIYFKEKWGSREHFRTYNDFQKYIKKEYFKDCAELILKFDKYKDGKEMAIMFGGTILFITIEIVAI